MRKVRSATARRPASVVRRSSTGLVAFAAWLVLAAPAVAGDAETFVRETAGRVFAAYSDPITDEGREEVFRDVLSNTFELKTIARFTLGRYWRVASAVQREEYLRLFEDFLVLAYANRFRDLRGVKLRVVGVRVINERDSLVQSEVGTDGTRPPIRIGWRVRHTGKGLRIIDVIVDGISMSVTQRDQFAAAIRAAGGKVEGLLAMLREKTGTPK